MSDRIQISTTNPTTLQMTVTSQGAPVDTEQVKLEVPVLGFTDTQTTTALGEVSFVVPAATGYLDLQILDATVRVASNFPKSLTLECQAEGAVWVGGITVDDDGITYYTGTAGAIPGPEGPPGPAGPGVPTGGTAGQVLAKIDSTDYNTQWVTGGGSGGAVDSVNGKTGVVTLYSTDISISDSDPLTIDLGLQALAVGNTALLESAHGASVLSGGLITQESATTFAIQAGVGHLITDEGNGLFVKTVTWSAQNGLVPTYGNTGRGTNIAIDTDGNLVQSPDFPTPEEHRTRIQLGQVYHPEADGQISAVQNASYQGPDAGGHIQDLFRGFGKINIEGNTYGAFGGLGFSRSAGQTMSLGANAASDLNNPNFLSFQAEFNLDFRTVTQNGVTGPEETTFNPDLWDNNGTLEPTPGVAPRWTNTYFYLFDTGQTVIMRGQTTYLTEFGARNGIATEAHNTWDELNDAAIFRCILTCVSTATNLADPAQAIFHEVGKFGTIAGASSGVTLATTDLTDTPADPPSQAGEILEWDGSVYQYTLLSGDNIPTTGSGGDSIALSITGLALDLATLDAEKLDSIGAGFGTSPLGNIVSVSQTDYDNLPTKVADTLYIISGA